MSNKETLGQHLRAVREAEGLSQEEVGRALERSWSTVGNWELGKTQPSASDIIGLCKLYGVSADSLLMIPRGKKKKEEKK